jgi:RPA family protein
MSDANPDLAADDGQPNDGDAPANEADAPADGSGTDSAQRPRREVAVRVLAAEYDEATCSYAESDEERAPTYVVTPTGARANRVFVVGVLTDVERVSGDVIRARIADPTGTFVVYAGQYQPDARGTFESSEPPEFVALTGKARTFSPDDSDEVYASIRPESVGIVDAETRDRWALRTAERTVERVDTMADVCATVDDLESLSTSSGLPASLAAGIPRAREHYETTPAYLRSLRTCAREVAELVAGDRDAVTPPEDRPDAGAGAFDDLPTTFSVLDDGDESASRAVSGGHGPTDSQADTAAATDAETDVDATSRDETGPSEPADPATATDHPDTAAAGPGKSAEAEASVETGGSDVTGDESTDMASDVEVADSDADGGTQPSAADAMATGATDDSVDGSSSTAGDGAADPTATEDAEPATAAAQNDHGSATDDAEVAAGADESLEDPLDPEEREQVEAEFGAEFESGAEVDGPGQAGIETPNTEDVTGGDAPDEAPPESDAPDGQPEGGEGHSGGDDGADGSAGEESALTDSVMEVMRELDDGDGADRTAVIERAIETTDAPEGAVEDAVTDALMDGRCYEPDESTLKPI